MNSAHKCCCACNYTGVRRSFVLSVRKDACKRMQQVTTLLCVVGQQCCFRLHGPKSLTGFKLYATSANIVVVPCKRTQHIRPNNVTSVCMGLREFQ